MDGLTGTSTWLTEVVGLGKFRSAQTIPSHIYTAMIIHLSILIPLTDHKIQSDTLHKLDEKDLTRNIIEHLTVQNDLG